MAPRTNYGRMTRNGAKEETFPLQTAGKNIDNHIFFFTIKNSLCAYLHSASTDFNAARRLQTFSVRSTLCCAGEAFQRPLYRLGVHSRHVDGPRGRAPLRCGLRCKYNVSASIRTNGVMSFLSNVTLWADEDALIVLEEPSGKDSSDLKGTSAAESCVMFVFFLSFKCRVFRTIRCG